MIRRLIFVGLLLAQSPLVFPQDLSFKPDVQEYKARIVPDLENKSLEGIVTIYFLVPRDVQRVTFNSSRLNISSVNGQYVKSHHQENDQLIIELSNRITDHIQVNIGYSGTPKRGLIFERGLAYTVFATDHWMICNMDPSDKARLSLEIIVPDTLDVITNSSQEQQAPAYTFGFAIGSFDKHSEVASEVILNYYSDQYSQKQLATVFKETPEILAFLEQKSGVSYNLESYSQVLSGDYYQEMAGLSMIKDSYGELVLADSTETNLITHELAHQWWGNQITCESWSHFWLNEGFATFLSAAYNELRFGKKKYRTDIEAYYNVYKKVKAKGTDKPLVFEDWDNPSKDDRHLVYFKGAYVLHLLKEKLGDDLFWKGIKLYSQENFGKSVTTEVFQEAMERASNQSLIAFFEEWVY